MRIIQLSSLLNRHGTKAAAVTESRAFGGASYHETPRFEINLNRPFITGIVHKYTGVPLFLGIIYTLNNHRTRKKYSTRHGTNPKIKKEGAVCSAIANSATAKSLTLKTAS